MYDNYSSLLKHGWLLFFLQHVSNCINLDEAVEKKNVIKFMVSVNFFFFSLGKPNFLFFYSMWKK